MNVLCIADQDHQRRAIKVDHPGMFEGIYLLDVKPTSLGLRHQKLSNTSGITRNIKKEEENIVRNRERERKESKKLKRFQKLLV